MTTRIILMYMSVLNSLMIRMGGGTLTKATRAEFPGREDRVLGLVPTDIYARIYVYKLIV